MSRERASRQLSTDGEHELTEVDAGRSATRRAPDPPGGGPVSLVEEMPRPGAERRLALGPVLAFAAVTLVFFAHALHLRSIPDDSFISYQYARHLAEGHGLVWNAGAPPVEGYTNFLWVVILAGANRLSLDLPLFSQSLGLACSVATLAYLYLLVRGAFIWWGIAALAPCILLAASGPFATWSVAGLETGLFTLAITAALCHVARYRATRTAGEIRLAAAALLVANLTRPEGAIVAAVLGALAIAGARREARAMHQVLVALALIYALPYAAYFAWRYQHFGFLFPNTFYAKTGGGATQLLRGLWYLALLQRDFLRQLAPAIVLWLLAKLGTRQGTKVIDLEAAARGRTLQARTALTGAVVIVAAYFAYVAAVGGDYMPMYRFFVPVAPLIALLWGAGFHGAWARAGRRPGLKVAAIAVLAIGLAPTLVQSTPLAPRWFGRPQVHEGTYHGVEFQRRNTARLSAIGRYFRDTKQAERESIATRGVGAIAYYSGLRVDDVLGIVDPHIAHTRPTGMGRGLPGHEKRDWPYVLTKKPTYIVLSSSLTAEPKPLEQLTGDMGALEVDSVRQDYVPAAAWMTDDLTGESGYFSYLERRDHRHEHATKTGAYL